MRRNVEKVEIMALWKKYKKTYRREFRNQLIEYYLPVVKTIAEKLSLHLPEFVSVEDLTSMGIMGLFSSIRSFNLKRGVRFETYCANRIRGAMIDGLRESDWVPRLVRTKSHRLEKTCRHLENILCRKPSDIEIAEKLRLSLNEYYRLINESTATSIIPFTYKDDDDETNILTSNILEGNKNNDDLKMFLNSQIVEHIKNNLSKKERLVLEMYFYEELTMDEIGYVLDITESRVSQILANLIKRLKNLLQKHKYEWLF
jgi:RNA polymerase sigma factor for flagellar operon FliA